MSHRRNPQRDGRWACRRRSGVRPWSGRGFLSLACVSLAFASAACGQPFRIPQRIRAIRGNLIGRVVVDGLTIEATAITDEDELLQQFDANMVLARILVVKVALTNRTGAPLDLHRLKFELRNPRRHRFKPLPPHKAVDQLYKYYKIKNYLIVTRERLEADFNRRGLQTKVALRPGEERQGLVFFSIPSEVDPYDPLGNLRLHLKRLRLPQSSKESTIEVPLRREVQ